MGLKKPSDAAEVPDIGRRQLLGYLVNERQSQRATREWLLTWLDTWCPVDPELVERVMRKVRAPAKPKRKR
jgi:hypothetical protein